MLCCLVPENIIKKNKEETRNKNKNTGDQSRERAPHYEEPRNGVALGNGERPTNSSNCTRFTFSRYKRKEKEMKNFFASQNALMNSMESFFRFLVTRKLYPTSADQNLRRFESGNQAWGFTVCLKVTKNKYLLPPPCCLVRQHLVLHPVLCGHSRHWNLYQRLL